jgi:X-X-X-Leu-X-X-Gly heptad repeat protein
MHKRRTVAWLVAVAVGLTLIPATGAMAQDVGAASETRAEKRKERRQNARITRVVRRVATVQTNVATLTTAINGAGAALADLNAKADGIDARLKVIEGAAPQIITGLGQLKTGLETLAAGTTRLGDAFQAVEYGRAGIFASNGTVAAGSAVTSADIPDDGNAITTGEDAIVVSQAAGAVGIDLRAAIRSNEEDGDDTSETAGQAGGYLFVVNLDTGVRVACGGAPNPPGIFGTTPGDSIVTPSGTVTNLPLKNIPGGVSRTDTSKPDATSTSLLPAACQFGAAAAGITYSVHYSVNFLDIPTTTTPGPKE